MTEQDTERHLLGIFRKSLRVPDLESDDDVFAFGANSIAIANAVMAAAKAGIAISVIDVYECRSIRRIAAASSSVETASDGHFEPIPLTPTGQFLMAEGRFAEQYNISNLWDFDPTEIEPPVLQEAVRLVMRSVPTLGIRFQRAGSGILQQPQVGGPDLQLEHVDLRGLPPDRFSNAVEEAAAVRQRSFVFEASSPPIQIAVFEPRSGPWKLFIVAHHLYLDGIGFRLFLLDLGRAYEACRDGREFTPVGSASAPDLWLQRLTTYANDECVHELPFWRGLPWDDYAAFRLPEEFRARPGDPEPQFGDATARALHHDRGQWTKDQLASFHYDQCAVGCQLQPAQSSAFFKLDAGLQFNAILFAVSSVLTRLTGIRDLWIDVFDAARAPIFADCDVSRFVGYVNEIAPLPLRFPDTANIADAIREVGRQRRRVPRRGLGFRALQYLSKSSAIAEEAARWPDPKVVVNYVASLQHDYPRELLDLKLAKEWQGPEMDESRTPYWLAFSFASAGGSLSIHTRHDPTVTRFAAAVTANEMVRETLERICEELARHRRRASAEIRNQSIGANVVGQ